MDNQTAFIKKTEYIDAHCHILPGVDHGAKDAKVAFGIAESLKTLGFSSCYATPHFYFYEEKVEDFIARRDISVANTPFPDGFKVLPGAEIAYESGISKRCDLSKLTIEGTDKILMELPMKRFTMKTVEEFFEIGHRHGVKIILAHAERYLPYMTFREYKELSNVDDIMFQINLYSLSHLKTKLFLRRLLDNGVNVIFGTDIHESDMRLSHSEKGIKYLEKALLPVVFERMMRCQEVIL